MVQLLVTYMEMRTRPTGEPLPSPVENAAFALQRLEAEPFLSLYRAVGEPLRWDQRLRMSADTLDAFLRSPSTAVYTLRVDGRAVGLCEFDRVESSDIELTHFGLIPDMQGRRLGPYLLDAALRAVWDRAPQRIWLHTDEWDHAKAQDTYRRAGFGIFAQKLEEVGE
ncbi:GNAT family N-acetyltransferase [Ensifer sp. HO-A22]|uniref:GNAT family N-acetyltransferase n=1 Tax=Ensifer oleiphilus TaxID=2742698 RepID=A0A7Y6UPA2_9HYPH|nr:GNAT family N-acetyltransferase [Ensifer oleiphilus]NVD41027.1 GNAT family N-acetyltransferase [Ensifer oleiphilus]